MDLSRLDRGDIRNGCLHYSRQKTGVEGVYEIGPDLQAELDLLTAGQVHLIAQDGLDRPYVTESLGNRFKVWAKAAGVPLVTIHSIRKGQATAIAEAGGTENEVVSYLPHTTSEETRRYTVAADQKRSTKAGLARPNSAEIPVQGGNQPAELVV